MKIFEKLEPRVLLSAAPWTADFHYKDIFNDGGGGLSGRRLAAEVTEGFSVDNLLTSSGSKTRSVINGNSADHNGALLFPDGQPRYRFAFLNGGSAASHSSTLGSTGRQRFADFYDNGGSVAGSCAGLYLVDNFKIADVRFSHNSRSGNHDVIFGDHEFTDLLGTDVVYNIPHYYGPIIRPTYSGNTPGVEYVGIIDDASGSIYRSENTPYLAIYKESSETGRFVGQTSHPEYYNSGPKADLMRTIVLYAMAGGETEPELKAELSINQVVTGRIGDGQYHRYTVEVEEGLDKLVVNSDRGEVFVQYENYAHIGSSISNSIENPVPGTYHISVYGDPNVVPRNGHAYELTVSDTDIFVPPKFEPIVENFSNGLPTENWEFNSTNNGRIRVIDGRLVLDNATRGGYSLNEAILHVDLSNRTDVTLSYLQTRHRDETHWLPTVFVGSINGDGVSYSNDGNTWYSLPLRNGLININLSELDHFFATEDFQIKFQQYDNYPYGTDGRSWDNIGVGV